MTKEKASTILIMHSYGVTVEPAALKKARELLGASDDTGACHDCDCHEALPTEGQDWEE